MAAAIDIRRARSSDIPAIARIYGHHALHGTGTFDTEPPGEQRFIDRLAEQDAGNYPFLIAVQADEVVGFAYAAPFRPRFGWRFSFEDAIYMAPGFERRGFGTALLAALLAECRKVGVRHVIAVIGDSANIPSLRVHERCGFAQIGTLRNVGFKHDRWLDVVLMQCRLVD